MQWSRLQRTSVASHALTKPLPHHKKHNLVATLLKLQCDRGELFFIELRRQAKPCLYDQGNITA